MGTIHLLTFACLFISLQCTQADDTPLWRYACVEGNCIKTEINPKSSEPALSLEACKMFCNEYGLLWPKPTGAFELGNFLSKLDYSNVAVEMKNEGESSALMKAAADRFIESLKKIAPEDANPKRSGKKLRLILINEYPNIKEFSLDFNESYALEVSPSQSDEVVATITAPTFFGVRHGLETLRQLIVYDDIRNQLLIVRDVKLDDKPVYPYRGLLLDTARNYYSVSAIKRTIDAMAAVKLNTFHWHITDSQSFPFVSKRRPDLVKYGAYSKNKIYTPEDIKDIVHYALVRGVRVLPEFDAPAHVGEGWQKTDLTVCFKAEPWNSYCVEPPCGQLNPTKDEVYDVLEDIYLDMADNFHPDIFHMGGDEVDIRCWNTSTEIQKFLEERNWSANVTGYLSLWDYFQRNAQKRAYKAFGKVPLILWTSRLTEFNDIENYLDNKDYIIQVWTTAFDAQINGLMSKGYKLIMSNYDALYFDCGFESWVGAGNNWCAPYIGWKKVYDNSPAQFVSVNKENILGGEVALWSEQADSSAIDRMLWPRAAAAAERFWAEPRTGWQDAQPRILYMRERLVRMGIQADALQPEWCLQNEGTCHN